MDLQRLSPAERKDRRVRRIRVSGFLRQYREERNIMEAFVAARFRGLAGINVDPDQEAESYRLHQAKAEDLIRDIELEIDKL